MPFKKKHGHALTYVGLFFLVGLPVIHSCRRSALVPKPLEISEISEVEQAAALFGTIADVGFGTKVAG